MNIKPGMLCEVLCPAPEDGVKVRYDDINYVGSKCVTTSRFIDRLGHARWRCQFNNGVELNPLETYLSPLPPPPLLERDREKGLEIT